MSETADQTQLNPPPTAPAPSQGVTRDEVRHVAALASLELTDQEQERMQRDLNAILSYVAELNELDTRHVEPMSQVSEILPAGAESSQVAAQPWDTLERLRADEPRASLLRATVMEQAPATDGVFFKVPKVIER